MSGTPDWKPGHRARPSSLAGSQMPEAVGQSTLRVSPSSIDMSGRHERAPIASNVAKRAICDTMARRAICDKTEEDKANDRRVRARGGSIFGGDAEGDIALPEASSGSASNRMMIPPAVPAVPQPRSHAGATFDRGWHIGAYFRCILRPGLAHRVYEGPPDGTPRVRLGPEEINVDFARPYKIRALFINDVYLAVQFKVPSVLHMSGFLKPGMMLWTNVRRGDDWWARLVEPSMANGLGYPPGADSDEEQQFRCMATRRLALVPRSASVAPAGGNQQE